jgi:GntR family transcriptional regulator
MAQQVPRYVEIADELRQEIESGALPRESQLPTEAQLQARFGASRNTVRDAVKLLVVERLLETRGREGTWITKAHVPFVTTLSTDPSTGLGGGGEEGATYPALVLEAGRKNARAGTPKVEILECPAQIATRLQIKQGEPIVSRFQKRYIDDTIWSLQTSYYPMAWVEKGATKLLQPKDITDGTVAYLAQLDLKQDGYRDLVSARLPNEEEKALFNLTHNHTVMEVYRTSFTADGTPVRVTVTAYPSDRNQIVYDIGTVPERREDPVQPEKRGPAKPEDWPHPN